MPPRPWTVLSHNPIERHEDNLWSVQGDLPGNMPLRRRMMVARLGDGRLAFLNGVPLDQPSMTAIEAWGTPAFLLVPNGFHRLDVAAWKTRYPVLKVLTGGPSRARVAKVVPVDGDFTLLPSDPDFEHVPLATRTGEGVVRVRSAGRTSLCFFGDVVMNNPDVPGFKGWIYGRLLDSTGGPRITRIAKQFIIADRRKVAAELRVLAEDPTLARLIPSHGAVMSEKPGHTLRALADGLSPQ